MAIQTQPAGDTGFTLGGRDRGTGTGRSHRPHNLRSVPASRPVVVCDSAAASTTSRPVRHPKRQEKDPQRRSNRAPRGPLPDSPGRARALGTRQARPCDLREAETGNRAYQPRQGATDPQQRQTPLTAAGGQAPALIGGCRTNARGREGRRPGWARSLRWLRRMAALGAFQAPWVVIWCLWSLRRLWVMAASRHSLRTAVRPLRWNR